MRTLVTGGKGFIGSHLIERLLNLGHEVSVLDLNSASSRNLDHVSENYRINHFCMDIGGYNSNETIAKLLKMYKIDYIFHLAGMADIVPSINKPIDYFNANVAGTINLLEAARRVGVYKFVYASSSSVYGIPFWEDIPTSEKAPIEPQYPYAETKYQGERWVSHYHRVYNLPTISLRLFNVYGPRSRTTGTYGAVFGTFLTQKINGKPFTVVGDGRQSRDFVFVTDVCDAFIKAAKSRISGEVFNVGSGKPETILRLAELLEGPIVNIPKRPGEPNTTHADISKIKRMLDWRPVVSFETGVKIMLDNIDYWRDAEVWTPETIKEATKTWFDFLGKRGRTAMPNSVAAVKTYKELRNLEVREANGYFQKFSEFLTGTKASLSFNWIAGSGIYDYKIIELAGAIGYFMELLTKNKANGKKIMVIGNGGSAAIAAHALEDYANIGGFKTIDFFSPPLLTCMANDYGYENVFTKPIEMFAEPGDMLFAISSSGKSPNIVKAVDAAKARGCVVVTFSGFDADNPLRKMGKLNFYTSSTHYGFVELAHQALIHCILDLFVRNKIYEEEIETLG